MARGAGYSPRRDAQDTTRAAAARHEAERYDWDDVASRYEHLCLRLAGRARQDGAGHATAADARGV